MNILAFDTALNKTYIVLLIDNAGSSASKLRIVSKIYESDEKNYHSAYLISGIKKLLEENSISLKDIDLFAVNHGPGSFTGIRAGVTVAKTFAKELNKNAAGINSLDILYKAYENLDPDIILDARREQFYFRKPDKKGSDNIELVPYSEISNYITKETVICDSSGLKHLEKYLKGKNIINFETRDTDLSEPLIKLAQEQLNFDNLKWNNLKAAYVQAPPVHKK